MLYAPAGLHGAFNTLVDCEISYAEFCNLGVSGKCNSLIAARSTPAATRA